jgi:8-oxo-dGTP pyrophosphatase MutT (NUDIX family)
MNYRPRVEVFCFRGPRVLAGYSKHGYVVFPGGGIDRKENAIEAAKREFLEEAHRYVRNLTIAHTPTTQVWPKDYAKKNLGYDGGTTIWMTGSCGELLPTTPHKDYESSLDWRKIEDVVNLIVHSPTYNDWKEDNDTRISILESHRRSRERIDNP